IRIVGKKRDDLQEVMALLRKEQLGIPLQFENLRD
ncbi:MAG TPA: YajQ family cyclic di-GMP-binding protein, partial [Coxiellaceae bacterium]|nr:YajQ family cyclic di-GMP-binding protein [Coxiellaceae bacterium]